MFVDNRINYNILDKCNYNDRIISKVDNIFRNYNMNDKKRKYYNKNNSIPYGYIIPKSKDVKKCRPVISYYNHPYKNLLNICNRVIMGMLKMIIVFYGKHMIY
jgi:hypothetical protein